MEHSKASGKKTSRDVTEYKITSVAVLSKSNIFKDLIGKITPEAIFIHVGSKGEDARLKHKRGDIKQDFESLMHHFVFTGRDPG